MTRDRTGRGARAISVTPALADDDTPSASAGLRGKVAIVTGAAAGIGLATARLLAREGALVMLADSAEQAGTAAAETLQQAGAHVVFQPTDVACEDDVRRLVQRAVDSFGRLDILFNNAGISGRRNATTSVDGDEWNAVLATNLTGTFFAMKHGIAAMIASGGGSVVNNASIMGLIGVGEHAAYSASKGGVIALTRAAAVEFAGKGVRVNCVCPGFVDTGLLAGMGDGATMLGAMRKVMTPLGRLGRPEEIAELVLFLASGRASNMTGAVIPVDGGYVAR